MIDSVARLQRARKNGEDEGFTLIELLVVVVIIGILIAIAVPLYLNYRKGANDKAAQSDVRGAVSAIEQCNADTGTYPSAIVAPGTTGCQVSRSTNTTLTYSGGGTAYKIVGTNSAGKPMYYCYDNTASGVKSYDTAAGPGTGATCA